MAKFLPKWTLWLPIACCVLGTGAAFADATETAEALPERRLLGGRPDFTWQQLPAGDFREQIGTLKPEARQRAETWLRGFRFLPEDVEFLRVDRQGGIYYADSFSLPAEAPAGSSGGDPVVQGTVPVSPFPSHLIFHSKPGAPNVLYLDFDGEDVTGTGWNASLGRDPIPAVAFDTDYNISTFSDAEQAGIKSMWQRVAEDYAPFNIDVTTERPSSFDNHTCHALITRNRDANENGNPAYPNAGGVAYVNVFGSGGYAYYRPAWVYDNGNGEKPSYISETISHETGHEMGLTHDGPSLYSGHGSGDTSWAPLMGVSWARSVSQWCKGEYYGATQTQDDLAIIAGKLGQRADDHGDTLGGATDLDISPGGSITSTTPETDPTNSDPDNKGVIEDDDDVDLFTFLAGPGEVQLTVQPWINPTSYRGGNLDVSFDLLDGSGVVLATADPPSTTFAALTTTVPGGRYYLRITGTGTGDPLNTPPTGYTDYGSVGQNFISGQVVEIFLWMINQDVTHITHDSATLQGYLVDPGESTPTVSVYWGTTDGVESGWDTTMTVGPRDAGPLSQAVSGLTPNTHYYGRFYGTHGTTAGWAAPSAEFVTAGTVPFSGTFDPLTPGNVYGQNGWEVTGTDDHDLGAALVQSTQTYAGSAQACSVFNAELTHAFSGTGAGASVLWTDMYVIPEPISSVSAVPSNSNGKAIFFVDEETGALAAMDGETAVLFTNKPAVPEDEWVQFTTRMDYGSKTWDLWVNSATVVYNLAFHSTNDLGFSRIRILDRFSAQPSYVDNVTVSPDRPAHILLLDSDGDALDDDWEREHFTSLDVSDGSPEDDWDGDRFLDIFEFLANTDPTNANSLLIISNAWPEAADQLVIEWQSASNRTYAIERSTNLLVGDRAELISNLPAYPPLNRYTVTVDEADAFYRIVIDD